MTTEEEAILEYVRDHPLDIKIIPDEFKSDKVYFEALKYNSFSFEFFPSRLKTRTLCIGLLKDNLFLLPFIPHKYKNFNFFLEIAGLNGYILEFIQEFLLCLKPEKAEEICLAAINNVAYSIFDIPKQLINNDILSIAIRKEPDIRHFFPHYYHLEKTNETCLISHEKIESEEKYYKCFKNLHFYKKENFDKWSEQTGKFDCLLCFESINPFCFKNV